MLLISFFSPFLRVFREKIVKVWLTWFFLYLLLVACINDSKEYLEELKNDAIRCEKDNDKKDTFTNRSVG